MITKMKVVLGVAVVALTLVVFVGPASADAVQLTNPSFEQDAVADGAMTTDVTGWTNYSDDQNLVTWNPQDADFPGATGSPGTLPATASGSQCLLNIGDSDEILIQALPGIIQPHETFTLTVAFGNPKTYGYTDNALAFGFQDPTDLSGQTGELLQNNNRSITKDTTLPPGSFKDQSYTLKTDDFIQPGAPGDTDEFGNPICVAGDSLILAIELGAGGAIDNVRLDLTSPVVPEPSTFVLAAIGTAALLGYGWRRRHSA